MPRGDAARGAGLVLWPKASLFSSLTFSTIFLCDPSLLSPPSSVIFFEIHLLLFPSPFQSPHRYFQSLPFRKYLEEYSRICKSLCSWYPMSLRPRTNHLFHPHFPSLFFVLFMFIWQIQINESFLFLLSKLERKKYRVAIFSRIFLNFFLCFIIYIGLVTLLLDVLRLVPTPTTLNKRKIGKKSWHYEKLDRKEWWQILCFNFTAPGHIISSKQFFLLLYVFISLALRYLAYEPIQVDKNKMGIRVTYHRTHRIYSTCKWKERNVEFNNASSPGRFFVKIEFVILKQKILTVVGLF